MLAAEVPTRETFANLPVWAIAFWYFLIFVSVCVFAWGVWRLARKYRAGRGPAEPDRPAERLARGARVVLSHSWIRRRDPLSGLGHLFVFYGFLVLFVGTAILMVQDDIAGPAGFEFFEGWFYQAYSLFLDVFGAILIAGLLLLAGRRWLARPPRLDYRRVDGGPEDVRGRYVLGDRAFLGILFFLALTGFLQESFRIAETDPSFETWSPIGWAVGQAFIDIGFDGGAAELAHRVNWWVHGLVALGFVSSIPFTKAVHMLAGPASVATRDDLAGRRLVELPPDAKPEEVGYQRITDFAPRHLLQLDACTKCGKCHEACPARASGYPLSPATWSSTCARWRRARSACAPGSGSSRASTPRPRSSAIRSGPRRCGRACSAWRASRSARSGSSTFRSSTSSGGGSSSRGRWTASSSRRSRRSTRPGTRSARRSASGRAGRRSLGFEVKDARKEPCELLWFVGDFASLDPRNVRNTQALARILHHAGVDFGILYDAEKSAGNDVRRVGEEGLYTSLAEENIADDRAAASSSGS